MKKTLIAFFLCLIFVFGGFVYISFAVNSEGDNVAVTEIISHGDKSAIEGMKVSFSAVHDNRLQWNMRYTFRGDEDKMETDFTFNKVQHQQTSTSDSFFNLFSNTQVDIELGPDGMSIEKPENYTGLRRAWAELIEKAEPNKEYTEIICFSDYIDYYPIHGDCYIDGTSLDFSDSWYDTNSDTKALRDAFSEFFKIPVIEGQSVKLKYKTNDARNVVSAGREYIGDFFDFSTLSVVNNGYCYITFDNRTRTDKIVDTSEIPGGYGLYRMPYKIQDGNIIPETEKLENAFKINEKNLVTSLTFNEEKTKLHLITSEENGFYLTVIDIVTMKEEQRLCISDMSKASENYVHLTYTGKDFLLFDSMLNELDENGYNRDCYVLISIDGEGNYKKEFSVPCYRGSNIVLDTYIISDAIWDGERLYYVKMASRIRYEDEGFDDTMCGFIISAYDKNGILFYGAYDTSLSAGESVDFLSSAYDVFTLGDAFTKIERVLT